MYNFSHRKLVHGVERCTGREKSLEGWEMILWKEDREREMGRVWHIGMIQKEKKKHSSKNSWKERETTSENAGRGLNKKSVPPNH